MIRVNFEALTRKSKSHFQPLTSPLRYLDPSTLASNARQPSNPPHSERRFPRAAFRAEPRLWTLGSPIFSARALKALKAWSNSDVYNSVGVSLICEGKGEGKGGCGCGCEGEAFCQRFARPFALLLPPSLPEARLTFVKCLARLISSSILLCLQTPSFAMKNRFRVGFKCPQALKSSPVMALKDSSSSSKASPLVQ